jgi:hypothetical protein
MPIYWFVILFIYNQSNNKKGWMSESEQQTSRPTWDQLEHGTAVIFVANPTTIEYKGDQKFEVGDEVQWVLCSPPGPEKKEKGD